MDATKSHRFLTETEELSIFKSTDAELAAVETKLDDIVERVFDGVLEPGAFVQLIKSGAFTASTIHVGDEPAFVIVHTRNALGWIVFEGAASLGKAPLKILFDGLEALARHFNAPAILYVTKLHALYRYGRGRGYKSVGVILCKPMTA